MPRDSSIKSMLVIGSGPIVIGQAAEFDYSGSQACRALREEGVRVILANSNPATIQTDADTADAVYLEPLCADTLKAIIEREKPDGFIATMAGQTGLNLAVELRDFLAQKGVRFMGTSIETIELAEDREKFRSLMQRIGEPMSPCRSCHSQQEFEGFIESHGLPVMVRADFALGGASSGIARTKDAAIAQFLLAQAQSTGAVMVEKSLEGLAEIEYEVLRDSLGNCITVCNMENFDPVGVHTGESVVIAPSQTLSNSEYHLLRTASIRIVTALGVVGACNVQLALDQSSGNYYVIEVNPRASRSSALASKATGYPIARVATKIALGYSLFEIKNTMNGKSAAAEPALDYVVVKVPRWPFDKFGSPKFLGTQMKSTGEAMAIGRTFEESFGKAIRSLELRHDWKTLVSETSAKPLPNALIPSELRPLIILHLLQSGKATVAQIAEHTKINPWFLEKLALIAASRSALSSCGGLAPRNEELVRKAKSLGLSDEEIASEIKCKESDVRSFRQSRGITPVFKLVDTCAGEYAATSPYCYSSYEQYSDSALSSLSSKKRTVIILGSGPIRIGQGIEFDYSAVHAVQALRKAGYKAVVINSNPETVSTDFDISDALYFEPLVLEDVLSVIDKESDNLEGVMVQFGGQTSINLAHAIAKSGARVLGTSLDSIDAASDRRRFRDMANRLRIPLVASGIATNREQALEEAEAITYPVLVRPSYVLGGRAMHIAFNQAELESKISESLLVSGSHPVIIDHFLEGAVELDVDLVGDGEEFVIGGIMEQIDEAGIHSGDSACVLPAQRLSADCLATAQDYALRLARELRVCGLCNIQMAVKGGKAYVIEVNPRASRTIPFVSKATGVPLAKVAALAQMGKSLSKQGLREMPVPKLVAAKVPVFSHNRFDLADLTASSEMKSTGEVMSFGRSFGTAYLKALKAANQLPAKPSVFFGECDRWATLLQQQAKDAGFAVLPDDFDALSAIKKRELGLLVGGFLASHGKDKELLGAAARHGCKFFNSAFAARAFFESVTALGGLAPAKKEIAREIHSLKEGGA